jgi:hypothetical protein
MPHIPFTNSHIALRSGFHPDGGLLRRRIRRTSPKGAGFDSPGRQPWVWATTKRKALKGRDSCVPGVGVAFRNLAPLGLHPPSQLRNPGLTRPGLSNLAPLGLLRSRRRNEIVSRRLSATGKCGSSRIISMTCSPYLCSSVSICGSTGFLKLTIPSRSDLP